jgi:hypothetical protein
LRRTLGPLPLHCSGKNETISGDPIPYCSLLGQWSGSWAVRGGEKLPGHGSGRGTTPLAWRVIDVLERCHGQPARPASRGVLRQAGMPMPRLPRRCFVSAGVNKKKKRRRGHCPNVHCSIWPPSFSECLQSGSTPKRPRFRSADTVVTVGRGGGRSV